MFYAIKQLYFDVRFYKFVLEMQLYDLTGNCY